MNHSGIANWLETDEGTFVGPFEFEVQDEYAYWHSGSPFGERVERTVKLSEQIAIKEKHFSGAEFIWLCDRYEICIIDPRGKWKQRWHKLIRKKFNGYICTIRLRARVRLDTSHSISLSADSGQDYI